MSLRVLSKKERELMTPECQQLFLRLASQDSVNQEVLERALAVIMSQDLQGIVHRPLVAGDLVLSYQRVHLAATGNFDNWYDFQPERYRPGDNWN